MNDGTPIVLTDKEALAIAANTIQRFNADLTTARQQLAVHENLSKVRDETHAGEVRKLGQQLAEARAEAKQWNDLHTAADYEVGALRTLASEMASELAKFNPSHPLLK